MVKIDDALTRGVADILPNRKGLAGLMAKKKITLYQGFDPSMPNLHLGNWIGIRKLAQFQKLDHKVIFLVGDFTGIIGDPTDKSAARKKMTRQQVLKNAKDYKKQIAKTLKFSGPNAAEIRFNSEWLSKLSFEDVVELASHFTVQQMIERDFFRERIKKQKSIYLHEFLYPLMQSYDGVAMEVDLEIGGNDQLFNMMAGRSLMRAIKKKEKYVLTMKLLTDPAGKKMGKTEKNTIDLTDSNIDMYGRLMALPDNLTALSIELLTDLPLNITDKHKPFESKKILAFDVVKQLHGEAKAKEAQKEFEKTFHKRMPEYKKEISARPTLLATIAEAVGSVSQAKRLIKQAAVDIDGATVSDPTHRIKGGEKIKIGKKIFVKVKK